MACAERYERCPEITQLVLITSPGAGDRQMNAEHELSPLDRVRQAEAEVAGRIAGSREGAERTVTEARERARVLIAEGQEAGRREGQAQYRRLILQAQDEARAIGLESQERVEALRRAEGEWMDAAVRRVVKIITAAGGDEP